MRGRIRIQVSPAAAPVRVFQWSSLHSRRQALLEVFTPEFLLTPSDPRPHSKSSVDSRVILFG